MAPGIRDRRWTVEDLTAAGEFSLSHYRHMGSDTFWKMAPRFVPTAVAFAAVGLYAAMRLGFVAPASTRALDQVMGPASKLERTILLVCLLAGVGLLVFLAVSD